MSRTDGVLMVVSGPSGVGKGTVCKYLVEREPNLFLSISATSRPPREGEQEGVHYYYKTPEEFQRMVDEDEFLEYAHYVSSSYGTPKAPCMEQLSRGNSVILEIEVQGGQQVKERYPDTVMVFVAPPSIGQLEERLRGRGTESEEMIQKRLTRAMEELQLMDRYDYIVVNDTVEQAAEQIKAIIVAEQHKQKKIATIIKKELEL